MAKFKELQVGQSVRIVGIEYSSAELGTVPLFTYGKVATIVGINTRRKKWVRLDNSWCYKAKDLEIVVEDTPEPVLTTDSSTLKVDASTPVGTKVRVLKGSMDGYYSAGAVGTVGRHDDDDRPRIDFVDDFWYVQYTNLEIVPQDTPDTVCKPESEPEPVVEPKELTISDFVVTRVRVKSTGAKGTVIGVTDTIIVVQHDEDNPHVYHDGAFGKVAQGRDNGCWWYTPSDLEIITEEV